MHQRANQTNLILALSLVVIVSAASRAQTEVQASPSDARATGQHSLRFNGQRRGSIVILPHSRQFNAPIITGTGTIECWVKPLENRGRHTALVNKAVGICKDDFALSLTSSMRPEFSFANSCSDSHVVLTGDSALVEGRWYHLAATWDRGAFTLFVDGISVRSRILDTDLQANDIPMSLGANNHWNGDYESVHAILDEIRYSATARYVGPFVPPMWLNPDSLTVFLFHCNEGFGKTLENVVLGGVDGILSDVSWSDDTPARSRPNRPIADSHTLLLALFDSPIDPNTDSFEHIGYEFRLPATQPVGSPRAVGISLQKSLTPLIFSLTSEDAAKRVSQLSIEFWLRIPEYQKTLVQLLTVILKREKNETTLSLLQRPDGKLAVDWQGRSGPVVLDQSNRPEQDPTDWSHIAISWDGVGGHLVIHRNGILVADTLHSKLIGDGRLREIQFFDQKQSYIGRFEIDEIRILDTAVPTLDMDIPLPPGELQATISDSMLHLSWKRRHNLSSFRGFLVEGRTDRAWSPMAWTVKSQWNQPLDRLTGVSALRVIMVDEFGFRSVPSSEHEIEISSPDWITSSLPLALLVAAFVGAGWLVIARRRKILEPSAILRSHIKLFGEFALYDEDGTNLAPQLSPKSKELFLAIFLHSIGDGREGIDSVRLSAFVWPEASSAQSKNNRGVAINRLRKQLKAHSGCELITESNKWRINLSATTSSDVLEFIACERGLGRNNGVQLEAIFERVLKICGDGAFLRGVSFPWLDAISADYTERAVRLLERSIDSASRDHTPHVLLLAESLLKWDPTHERANRAKIESLWRVGKHKAAKEAYTDYVDAMYDLGFSNEILPFDHFLTTTPA